ncbi:DNA-binding protein [Streptomyces sp. NPDC089919]|uniref:nSTAND1 domain-containing NTPase n=1 Tax=Streptomyces sp. NPDC089919 TaxID=3155188 RepID=UPI00342D3D24
MGRSEKPLDPADGPAAEFAVALRELRREAGGPTYAAMARRAGAYSVATLSRAAGGDQLPTLPVVLAYVAACGGDPDRWRERWQRAADELAARQDGEAAPYLGLARYEPGDRELFFGREQLVDDLVALTRAHRVVVVFGPSGSGKSSLLRAGLVPRLRAAEPGTAAAVRLFAPGGDPPARHRAKLAPAAGEGDTWLIVDQFEEVFTLCRDPAERALFVKELLAAAGQDGARVRVVLGVRADFYAPCLGDPALAAAVREASLPVTPMSREELRRAIVAPAAARSAVVERALTARLVEELHGDPAALPLLSHALLETWRRRTARRLTLEAYEAAGGVHGAIARTAEATYGGFDPGQAATARRILLRLVSPGEDGLPDTRRPARGEELGTREEIGPVLDALAAARLVTLDHDTVELAHETLLTSWPRLARWLAEDHERLRLRQRLTAAAQAWQRLDGHASALAPAALLTALRPLVQGEGADHLTPLESAFLHASNRARTRAVGLRRAAVGALAVLAVFALLAGAMAHQSGRAATERRNLAAALRAAVVAENLRATDPSTAARLNVAAWRTARTPQTQSGLFAALTDRRDADVRVGTGGGVVQSEFAEPDGTVLSVSRRTQVERWDLRDRRRLSVHRLAEPGPVKPSPTTAEPPPPDRGGPEAEGKAPDPSERVRPSPDGRWVAAISQGGSPVNHTPQWAEVRVQDLRAGTRFALPLPAVPLADDLAWGGAGRLLAVAAPGTVQLWDVPGRRLLFDVPAAPIRTGVALSADGRRAALCGRQGVEVWDVPGRRRLDSEDVVEASVPAQACSSDGLRLSPDGAWLAVRSGTGILLASAGGLHSARRLPAAGVTGFAFDRTGSLLAAVAPDAARVWRTADLRADPLVFHQALRHDRPGDVRIDDRAGLLRYVHADQRAVAVLRLGRLPGIRWSAAGTDPVLLSPDGSVAMVLRRSGGTVVPEAYPGMAGTGAADPRAAHARPTVRLPALAVPAGADPEPVLGAFSPDGRLFAYAASRRPGDGTTVKLWDLAAGRALRDVTVPREAPSADGAYDDLTVTSLAPVLRDGKPVVYGSVRDSTGSDMLWDLTAFRTPFMTLSGPHPLAVRPDGRLLALSDGSMVRLPGAAVEAEKMAGLLGAAFTPAFSPDGHYLALADTTGRIALWPDAPAGSPEVLDGGPYGADEVPGGFTSVAFSPDGNTLAVGDATGAVRLWDVPSRAPLGGPLTGIGDPVSRLAFTRDGAAVLAQGPHTAPVLLRTGTEEAVAAVCARTGGGLEAALWRALLPELPYRATCPGPPR